jgi:hypothetical protein
MTGGFNLHTGDAIRTVKPNPSGYCLPGLVSASSSRPISAIAFLYGFNESFRSPLGVSRTQLLYTTPNQRPSGITNPLTDLLSPFERKAEFNQLLSRKELVQDLMSLVRGNLEDRAKRTIADSDQLSRYARSAADLSMSQVLQFAEDWGNIREKYWDLIQNCRDIRDLFPEPVRASSLGSEVLYTQFDGAEGPVRGINSSDDDLRNIFIPNAAAETSTNLRVKNLAESAAMIEFVLKHRLSSAVSVGIDGIEGVNARVVPSSGVAQQFQNLSIGNDFHRTGVAWSTLSMSFYMKSVLACLQEINAQIPNPEKTVFHLTSEFGRSAGDYSSTSNSAPGAARQYFSDHMWDGNWLCVYSSAVQRPAVIGNIYRTRNDWMRCSGSGSANGNKLGTDGYGAPVLLEGGTPSPLLYAHGTTGVAAACGVESPTPNFHAPFGRRSNGVIEPFIADGVMLDVNFTGCNPMPAEALGDETPGQGDLPVDGGVILNPVTNTTSGAAE